MTVKQAPRANSHKRHKRRLEHVETKLRKLAVGPSESEIELHRPLKPSPDSDRLNTICLSVVQRHLLVLVWVNPPEMQPLDLQFNITSKCNLIPTLWEVTCALNEMEKFGF